VAEVSRVLADHGVAFFITPNAPADFENPYHVHLFEAEDLDQVLGRHFVDVQVWGLDGDPVVKADFERRRRWARWMLRVDVFGLRHRLPRRWYVRFHATGRRIAYPVVSLVARFETWRGSAPPPRITAARFSLVRPIDTSTLVLFAVARSPKRS
jgi:hypothetical protein